VVYKFCEAGLAAEDKIEIDYNEIDKDILKITETRLPIDKDMENFIDQAGSKIINNIWEIYLSYQGLLKSVKRNRALSFKER